MANIPAPYEAYPYPSPMNKVTVTLKNQDLWRKFHKIINEMIITKQGRRPFPILEVEVENLDPLAKYHVFLEFIPHPDGKHKFVGNHGWKKSGIIENQSPLKFYSHPHSPALGRDWMDKTISFNQLKITNNMSPKQGQIVLSSMHKYRTVIVIEKVSHLRERKYFEFPETEFIAVTAYQNREITQLKVDNNAFAKGFRENGKAGLKRKKGYDSDDSSAISDSREESSSPVQVDDDPIELPQKSPKTDSVETAKVPQQNIPSLYTPRYPKEADPYYWSPQPYPLITPQYNPLYMPYWINVAEMYPYPGGSYYPSPYPAHLPYPMMQQGHPEEARLFNALRPEQSFRRLTDFSMNSILGIRK